MNCEFPKRLIALLLSLIFLFVFSALAEETADTWFCLNCSGETTGDTCEICGQVRDFWCCASCGTSNLSSVCRNCGKSKEESLKLQAADADLYKAYPAVRILAAADDSAALYRLGRYYEKGIIVPQDTDKALSCFSRAGNAGNQDAWIYLGRLYDAGARVEQNYSMAMKYYQKALQLGSAEACWYIGSF